MKAAVYIRISKPDQTLEGQEAELIAYCRGRGWEPVVYRDVQTGAVATRPGLEAMMRAVRSRKFVAVVCVKIDRLGRSLSHFLANLHELQMHGVGFVCRDQGIDTVQEAGRVNPAAHFFITILAAVAEFERELIRERTIDGLRAARARGAKIGRPVKMTGAQRAEILRLRCEGRSLRQIAAAVGMAGSTVWLVVRATRPSVAQEGAAA